MPHGRDGLPEGGEGIRFQGGEYVQAAQFCGFRYFDGRFLASTTHISGIHER